VTSPTVSRRLTKWYRLQVSSVGDDRSYLDLDTGRGRCQRRDLNKGAGGANLPKHLQMGLSDKRSVGHVHDIHDRAHDVAQPGTGLGKTIRHQIQGSAGLGMGVAVQVGRAGRGAGHEHPVAHSDRARVAVLVLERIAGRNKLPGQGGPP